ncbi:MAG: 7-cyano-7-deazaguanine synthase, partial [Chloroflexi bacterium]|nr:7-cyano-7-deazaguanine synthase [Chloroflexota bacterium]
MPSYAVSLLSGGLDSTTVTALAKGNTDQLTALTFHYGQSHSKEVDCAANVAQSIGVEQELMDISFLGKVAWYSALTNPDRFPVPENQDAAQMGNSIPITYVPLRNTIFLSLAAAYLESQALHAIEIEGISPTNIE